MTTLALAKPRRRTVLLDVLLGAAVVSVPTLSHVTALPLYQLDPMRMLLFAAVLFSSRRNALAIALCLPLLSLATSGHPVFPKVMLIQGELALNAAIFYGLWRRWGRFAAVAVVSILVSKAAYYAAKLILVRSALLDGDVVATAWGWQLVVLAFIALVGRLIHGRFGSRVS